MAKSHQAPAVITAEPALQPVGDKTKQAVKSRSQHLSKLLALREEIRKIKKPAVTQPKDKAAANGKVLTKAQIAKNGKAVAAAAAAAAEAEAEEKKKSARRRKKAPYTKAELKEFRELLVDERERLLKDLRQLDDLADSNRQTTHATFSSHQADAASDFYALESTYIQRRYEEERFAQVCEALRKLDEGTFGSCEFCMEEPQNQCATCPFIPVDRLRAKPFAKMCMQLRVEMEKKNRR